MFRHQYSKTVYATAMFLSLISQVVARVLIHQGYPVLQSYLASAFPSLIIILLIMRSEYLASSTKQLFNSTSNNEDPELLAYLQTRLIGMVGRKDIAYQLVNDEKLRRPGKPEWWYWKAAIDSRPSGITRWD